MTEPLSDARLAEIRDRTPSVVCPAAHPGEVDKGHVWVTGSLSGTLRCSACHLSQRALGSDEVVLLAEVDRLRAALVSTRYELSDVKLRRDDARAGRQDAENEVDRLRARLAEIAELHASMGGDCGYCADETGGAHRWPCPTANLAAPTT